MNPALRLPVMIFLALISLVAGNIPAQADPRGAPWMDGPERRSGRAGLQGGQQLDFMGPCRRLADLSEDQVEELDRLGRRFRQETRDMRREIRQHRLALAAELAKKTPDAEAASRIQQALSGFRAALAQKRLEHLLLAKKIAPDIDMRPHRGRAGFGPRRHR